MQDNTEYKKVLNNLSQALCEHAEKGFSGELVIKYNPRFRLFTALFENWVSSDSAVKAIEDLQKKVVTFSQDTKHNEDGNEAGYKIMVHNKGKTFEIWSCYRYKLNLEE